MAEKIFLAKKIKKKIGKQKERQREREERSTTNISYSLRSTNILIEQILESTLDLEIYI